MTTSASLFKIIGLTAVLAAPASVLAAEDAAKPDEAAPAAWVETVEAEDTKTEKPGDKGPKGEKPN